VCSEYEEHYYRVMTNLMSAWDVGGQSKVRQDIRSSDEMTHRRGCETLSEIHIASHKIAMQRVGRKKSFLPNDIAIHTLESDLDRFGVSREELNLQRIFSGLDKQQDALQKTLEELAAGYDHSTSWLSKNFPRYTAKEAESEWLKGQRYAVNHSISTLNMLTTQTEESYWDSPRRDELVGRFGTLMGTADALNAEIAKLQGESRPPISVPPLKGLGWIEGLLMDVSEGSFLTDTEGLIFVPADLDPAWKLQPFSGDEDPSENKPRFYPWRKVNWARLEKVADVNFASHPKLAQDVSGEVLCGFLTDRWGEVKGSDFFVILPSPDCPSDAWLAWFAGIGVRVLEVGEHIAEEDSTSEDS